MPPIGVTPKKKKKGQSQTQAAKNSGGGGLPPMPKKPTFPTTPPKGKLTSGDKRFIRKEGSALAEARREGKAAATAQVRGIEETLSNNLNRQSKKLRRENSRVLKNMDRLVQDQRKFGNQQRAGVARETARLAGGTNMYGGSSGLVGGLTGSRRRTTAVRASTGNRIAGALEDAGRGIAKAGNQAQRSYARAAEKSAGQTMSIVDVLAAERKSDDQRFLTEMKYNLRQMRQEQAFQMMMANIGFEQDIYKMQLQNRLEAEYLEWQHENGYLLKPEEQAALDWKYKKKELLWSDRAAKKDQDPAAAARWDAHNTAVTDAVASVNAAISDPKKWAALKARANAQVAAGNAVDQTQALVQGFTPAQGSLPETVDPGVVTSVIRDMIESRKQGEIAPEGGDGYMWAPSFDEVQDYILQADVDGSMASYAERKSGAIKKLHEDYKSIAVAAETVNTRRNELLAPPEEDEDFNVAGAAVATTATAAAAYGVAKALGSNKMSDVVAGVRAAAAATKGETPSVVAKILGRGGFLDPTVGVAARAKITPSSVSPFEVPTYTGNQTMTAAEAIDRAFLDGHITAAEAAQMKNTRIAQHSVEDVATAAERANAALARGAITAQEADELINISKFARLGKGAIALAGAITPEDAPLDVLRRANPKLYMEIAHSIGYFPSEEADQSYTSEWEQEHMQ